MLGSSIEMGMSTVGFLPLSGGTMTGDITLASGGSLISSGAISLKPSGDTDDYFTFTTASDIPTITATGATGIRIDKLGIDIAPSASYSLNCNTVYVGASITTDGFVQLQTDGNYIRSRGVIDTYASIKAFGSAYVEVARFQGATNPFFGIGYGTSATAFHGIAYTTVIVTADHATHAALNAAGLTDNAILWQQPAGSVLKHIKCVLSEQFVAVGLTDFDFTIGDGGDVDGIIAPGAMNGTSDAVNTAWKTHGAYWDSAAEGGQGFYQHAAVDWYLYATAVGANLNTLTAGTLTFYITYELGQ